MKSLKFGKYRLVAELGQGGMADVILALAQGPVGFNKLVVVKKLREHLADDPEFVGMLIDEARLAARLNHPNIVHTNEVGEIDGYFFIAMEYLEGQPLTRTLRRAQRAGKDISLEMQVRIIADVLAGLHYAHELTDYDGTPLDVVHRDVTPSNVFVTYDGLVKVVDFGIAKASGRSTETKTGVVKGKMTYMAPEQALGHAVDRRADIFSCGVMLWEAVSGKRMWKGLDEVVILSKLINDEIPRSPKEFNPDVPDELDAITQKALAPKPDDRFETAQEFQAALEDWLEKAADPQPSYRTIGNVVSELFENDREEIRGIIESQLAKLKEEGEASLEPVEVPQPSSKTPSSMSSSTEISAGPLEEDSPTSLSVDRGPEKRRRSLIGLSLGLVGAVGAIIWLIVNRGEDEVVAASSQTPSAVTQTAPEPTTSATSSPTASPQDEKVLVTLRAAPSEARFFIDDGPGLENPFNGERPRDGERHTVRVKADGYQTKEIEVRFDKDVMLDVSLDEKDRPARVIRVPRKSPPPEPDPEPAPKPDPQLIPPDARPQPKHDILRGDPWEDD